MDIVDSVRRSRMMSGIKSKNTKPELILRKYLHSQGIRFRLHVGHLAGKPDIFLPKHRLCIFVHGCFWHNHEGCRYATMPKTRPEFWKNKFLINKQRDINVKIALLDAGWRVFELWECGFRNGSESLDWLLEHIYDNTTTLSWPDYICGGDQ
ncbi:very short patch repair endonuclease [Pectobacterium punjabense]|uniref:very short patch repair endonuclease n=1 Tax=Pectobacterium punjabense TaxID=2108399 RepID=UPI0024053583|nr:very short patch repair endonuclease [Pectobacterium punjabense]MDG0796041.1 very short patch repair endonuclease [Pectobacterium punjabense]